MHIIHNCSYLWMSDFCNRAINGICQMLTTVVVPCVQVNIVEQTVEIPHKWHTSMIGAKGQLIREISDECGSAMIRFPNENMQSNKVFVRGAKEEVEKAKKRLLEVASDVVSNMHHVHKKVTKCFLL